MAIGVDTHVHLYPNYDLNRALTAGRENLKTLVTSALPSAKSSAGVLCLTERHDCNVFRAIREKRIPNIKREIAVLPGEDAIWLDGRVLLIAGRQIITAERVEVLALGKDLSLRDGAPVQEVIRNVRAEGALPVLPWSPGKWSFNRGAVIRTLLEDFPATDFAVGDIPIRPSIFPEPELLRFARTQQRKVIVGSDPLPVAGEERRIGSFGMVASCDLTENGVVAEILALLQRDGLTPAGSRNGLLESAARLIANEVARRKG